MFRKISGCALTLALCAALFRGVFAPAAASPAASPAPSAGVPFTEEERAYLRSCGTLRVGYVQDRIPVSFTDDNGELGGVSRTIFDRVAAISGLSFEYVELPTDSVTYEYLLGHGLDLVTSVEYNEENKHANGILISEPYLNSRKVVVTRSGLDFRPDAALSVAISTGSQTIKKVLNGIFPNFTMVDYPSTAACFDAVAAGRADLTIQNQYVTEYWVHRPAYEELKMIPALGLADQMCFSAVVAFGGGEGPSPEEGQVLIDILDKSIAMLTEDEVASYTIQAVLDNQYTFTLSDFLYRYRYAVCILAVSLAIIGVLAAVLGRQHIRSLAAQADSKAKGEFLSAMSHEIRTPLNGLIGLNYLISQRLDDRAQLERYLQQSAVTARYLLRLVNDMLDMSSIQGGTLELFPAPMDLTLSVSTVESLVRGAMADKGLEFRVEPDLPELYVVGDEVRVQQVLLHLLDNARKFTPRGGRVTLSASQSRAEDGAVVTRFEVTDTGCGMSEEFQKHIFDSFAQERETVSQGNQGTGLGLPVSRSVARMMGGDITFTSRKGEGSRFVFTFSARPAPAPEPPGSEAPAQALPGAGPGLPRILVAEDNALNAEIIVELLEGEGFPVTLARDGQEAYELFRDAPPHTFDVILMDLLMPRMDGYQAAAAIRALPREDAGSVYIIACTANSSRQERARVLSGGLDDFLSKPVDLDALLEKISSRRARSAP